MYTGKTDIYLHTWTKTTRKYRQVEKVSINAIKMINMYTYMYIPRSAAWASELDKKLKDIPLCTSHCHRHYPWPTTSKPHPALPARMSLGPISACKKQIFMHPCIPRDSWEPMLLAHGCGRLRVRNCKCQTPHPLHLATPHLLTPRAWVLRTVPVAACTRGSSTFTSSSVMSLGPRQLQWACAQPCVGPLLPVWARRPLLTVQHTMLSFGHQAFLVLKHISLVGHNAAWRGKKFCARGCNWQSFRLQFPHASPV